MGRRGHHAQETLPVGLRERKSRRPRRFATPATGERTRRCPLRRFSGMGERSGGRGRALTRTGLGAGRRRKNPRLWAETAIGENLEVEFQKTLGRFENGADSGGQWQPGPLRDTRRAPSPPSPTFGSFPHDPSLRSELVGGPGSLFLRSGSRTRRMRRSSPQEQGQRRGPLSRGRASRARSQGQGQVCGAAATIFGKVNQGGICPDTSSPDPYPAALIARRGGDGGEPRRSGRPGWGGHSPWSAADGFPIPPR